MPARRGVVQVKHIVVAGFPLGWNTGIRLHDHQVLRCWILKLPAPRVDHGCVMTGAFVLLSSASAPVTPTHTKTEKDADCHSAKHFAHMLELLRLCVLCVVAAFAIRIREGWLEGRFACRFSGWFSRRHRGRLKSRRRRHI